MSLSKLISSTYFVCNTGSIDGTYIHIDKPLEDPDILIGNNIFQYSYKVLLNTNESSFISL